MAEDTTAAAGNAGGDTAAAATAAATAAAAAAAPEDKTLLGGTDTAGDTTDAGEAGAGAADDWRTAYGEDKELQKILARLSSPEDLGKKLLNQEKAIRSRPAIPELPQGATEEQVAAYRKAAGIPDKPEGYELAFPQDVGATEADTAALGQFQAFMHDRNVPPAAAKAAFEFYTQRMAEGRVAMAEAAREATMNGLVELRAEWKGKEFTRNMKLALENVESALGDKSGELAHLTLANGQKLGDHPLFLRYAVHNGRATADDEALIGGDVGGGGQSIDDEYKALIKKSVTPGQKMSDGEFARMQELAGARNRREQGGRRAA